MQCLKPRISLKMALCAQRQALIAASEKAPGQENTGVRLFLDPQCNDWHTPGAVKGGNSRALKATPHFPGQRNSPGTLQNLQSARFLALQHVQSAFYNSFPCISIMNKRSLSIICSI